DLQRAVDRGGTDGWREAHHRRFLVGDRHLSTRADTELPIFPPPSRRAGRSEAVRAPPRSTRVEGRKGGRPMASGAGPLLIGGGRWELAAGVTGPPLPSERAATAMKSISRRTLLGRTSWLGGTFLVGTPPAATAGAPRPDGPREATRKLKVVVT